MAMQLAGYFPDARGVCRFDAIFYISRAEINAKPKKQVRQHKSMRREAAA
ncbi:MAG TPA: hypothetical protein VFG34_04245 [Sphingopyxis sp.]|nr:hypothetical protein [Sphingopyxis sp.]